MKKIFIFTLIASQSFAASFVIPTGTTETTQQVLSDPGDTGLVEEGATLTVANIAVQMSNTDQEMTNNGLISTTTAASPAINLTGSNNSIVENNGTISTVGSTSTGIAVGTSNDVEVYNHGTITTTGNSSRGISNTTGSGVYIENTGEITTQNSNSQGIFNSGGLNPTIVNKGTITTQLGTSHGIFNSNGDNGAIYNYGTIETVAGSTNGLYNLNSENSLLINYGTILTAASRGLSNELGQNSTLINKGRILTTGNSSIGLDNRSSANSQLFNEGYIRTLGLTTIGVNLSFSDDSNFSNSGIITSSGDGSIGVRVLGSNQTTVENTGTIQVFGAGSTAVSTNGTDIHLINSGKISSEEGFALSMSGTNQQLTLEAGSNIQGGVISLLDTLDVNVGKGLNLVLTLDETGEGFGAITSQSPYVVIDNTLVVIDRTAWGLQSDVVADLSDTVLNGIYRHRFGFGSCCMTCPSDPCAINGWIEGVGSYRNRSARNQLVGYRDWNSGFLFGANTQRCDGYVGAFGGYLYGKAEARKNSSEAKTHNVVGGLTYEKVDCDTFWGATLMMGWVRFENDRHVMNNLAEDGIEHAKSTQDGFLLAPEFTWTRNFSCLEYRPNVTLTGRYAGLFFGSDKESGSAYNFKIDDRNIHLLTGRGEVSLPLSFNICGKCLSFEPYVGGFIRVQPGCLRVKGTIFDERLSFNDGSKRTLGALLYGFRADHSKGSYNFYMSFEGSHDNASSSRYLGQIGVYKSF